MLEFANVSKSFWTGTQRKIILDRVSFRVELGTSLGILAPDGTGKTTLIKMMAGLEKPDEGEIHRRCRISFPLGFMGGVMPKLSARENCRYIAKLYGIDTDYVEAYCRWLCGLEEYFDQAPKERRNINRDCRLHTKECEVCPSLADLFAQDRNRDRNHHIRPRKYQKHQYPILKNKGVGRFLGCNRVIRQRQITRL